jgi:hypothetical protein
LPEIYKQLGVFGFCAIGLESDFENVVNFKVLPLGSYYYSKNYKGGYGGGEKGGDSQYNGDDLRIGHGGEQLNGGNGGIFLSSSNPS